MASLLFSVLGVVVGYRLRSEHWAWSAASYFSSGANLVFAMLELRQ